MALFTSATPRFQRGRQKAKRIHVTAPPVDGMQQKSLA